MLKRIARTVKPSFGNSEMAMNAGQVGKPWNCQSPFSAGLIIPSGGLISVFVERSAPNLVNVKGISPPSLKCDAVFMYTPMSPHNDE